MSAELDTSIQDVKRTGNVLTVAQWSVASVVMAGSAYSAGLAFQHFHESFAAGFITGVGVDFALASWLLIARRLRDAGVNAAWGPILEGTTALMTLCLNAGTSVLQHKYLLAGFHTFLPIVLFILSMAGGEAHQKLHRKMKEKEAQKNAAAKADAERQRQKWEADQRQIKAGRDAEQARQGDIRKDNLRTQELAIEKHQREIADRREARVVEDQRSINDLAGTLLLSTSLRALAMTAAHRQNVTPAHSRTPATSPRRQPSPAPVASGSPADRQPASPARRQGASGGGRTPPPAASPDMDRLVMLARELLVREPNMGRPALAKHLAEATGTKITDHRAKAVKAAIEAEREAQFKAELQAVLGGTGGE